MDSRAAAAGRVEALARHLQGTQLDGRPQEVSGQAFSGVELSPCSSTVRRTLPRFDSNVLANYIDDLRSMKNEVYEVRLRAAPCIGCRSCIIFLIALLRTWALAPCSSFGSTRSSCRLWARE